MYGGQSATWRDAPGSLCIEASGPLSHCHSLSAGLVHCLVLRFSASPSSRSRIPASPTAALWGPTILESELFLPWYRAVARQSNPILLWLYASMSRVNRKIPGDFWRLAYILRARTASGSRSSLVRACHRGRRGTAAGMLRGPQGWQLGFERPAISSRSRWPRCPPNCGTSKPVRLWSPLLSGRVCGFGPATHYPAQTLSCGPGGVLNARATSYRTIPRGFAKLTGRRRSDVLLPRPWAALIALRRQRQRNETDAA